MIVLIVLEIAVAIAVPLWSGAAQRDQEEEMIFRGLQYAEAIRVFQQLNGRLPASFKELAENEPRVLRRAWINPIDDQEGWIPILQPEGLQEIDPGGEDGAGRRLGGGQPGLSGPRGDAERGLGMRQGRQRRDRDQRNQQGQRDQRRGRRGAREQQEEEAEPEPFLGGDIDDLEESTYGAFFGVKPGSDGEAMLTFFDGESYGDWEFRPELLVQPPNADGRIPVPRLWTQRFWVPVPGAGEPEGGEGPSEMRDRDRERDSMFDRRDSDRQRNQRQRY